MTWARTIAAKKSGNASAWINLYNYSSTGHLDYLISPLVDVTTADSIFVSFDRAYKRYALGTSFSDTLLIQVSTSCGTNTFPIITWKKGGDNLSTSPGTFAGNWIPGAADWLREKVDIKPFLPSGSNSVQVAFVSKNGYGQNLFLDDINISTVILLHRDAQVRAITNPVTKQCTGTFTPSVDIANNGKDTLTSVRVVYKITGPSFSLTDSVSWTGSLVTGGVANVSLKPVTLGSPGTYLIQAYTKLPNNADDQVPSNDTVTAFFRYVATVPAPLFEGFESGAFPPANWGLVNQDGLGTWFRTTAASRTGFASAVMDNYDYDAKGTNDDLESPVITYSGIDSAFLTFNLAHATYLYPGSTGLPLDTLQIFVTKDCGKTLIPVYNKWGEELQTVNDPNNPYIDLFIPRSASQWRKEGVDLSQAFGSSGSVQIIFRSKGNYGNSLFLDDINIVTKTLPLKLKQNGYLISPNPFNTAFSVQHYIRPTALRGIQVTNSAGQVVFRQNYNGNAQSLINIDLSRYAAGMYIVKLIYNDKVIAERVIKRS